MFNLDAAVCTDVGKVRNNNEDNYYLCGRRRERRTGLFNSSTVFAGLYYI